ncbi:hypothetical protein [Pyruvatibacter sp.]|uniref:hypothetical protein n=1 Tax=Pyruvatibacter sp. TaxID=1981328 RepID=UPI003264C045
MQTAAITAPLPTVPYQEPTHRFGRALDDRLPATGIHPAGIQSVENTPDGSPITTASTTPAATAATDEDGFSFDDLLDIVNPLQHLPVVSTMYREITGDEIRPESRVLGGGLFGGVLGAAASLVDVAVETFSGDSMGGHVMTALFGGDGDAPVSDEDAVQVAAREAATTPPPVSPALPSAPSAAPGATRPAARTSVSHAGPQAGAAASDVPTAPALQSLSPSAFDALLETFGTSATPANNNDKPGPGLAYAPSGASPGRLVNKAL